MGPMKDMWQHMDKGLGVIQGDNLECDMWQVSEQVILTHPDQIGWEKRRRERERGRNRAFRVRSSHFSLHFPKIGSSNPCEIKGKVNPHCKSYAWVPVLWSFDKSER